MGKEKKKAVWKVFIATHGNMFVDADTWSEACAKVEKYLDVEYKDMPEEREKCRVIAASMEADARHHI